MVEDKRRVRKIAANRARIYIGRQCAFVVVPDNAQKKQLLNKPCHPAASGHGSPGFLLYLAWSRKLVR